MLLTAWAALALLCFLLQLALHVERRSPPKLRRVSSADVCFSGNAVREGRWWVFVTATLGHADWPHLTNNLIHFAGYAPELEAAVGPGALVVLFVLAGAAGWAVKLAHAKLAYGEMYEPVAQFMTGVGSSPATYGLAFCAALLCAPEQQCCGAAGAAPPSWAWPLLLGLNKLAFDAGRALLAWKGGADGGQAPQAVTVAAALGAAAALGTPACVAALLGSGGGLSVWAWLFTYLSFCEQHRAFKAHYLREAHSAADNMGHLGGAAFGVLAAFALRPGLVQAHTASGLATVAACLAYVTFRAVIHTD